MKNAQNIPNLNSTVIHNALKGFYSSQMSPCHFPEKPHKALPLPLLTGCLSLGANSPKNREIPPLPASPKWEESKINLGRANLRWALHGHWQRKQRHLLQPLDPDPIPQLLPRPYSLHENQHFPMSSKWIHLTPKRHSLNPLHRIILGTAKLLQTINRNVTFSVSQPGAKRNPWSTPLWNMITWEFSPNNNGTTPTQATLNLSLQTLHVQTISSRSHGTVQIFPISTQGSHCWAPPLSLDSLVSTRDLPTLVPVAQVGGNSSNCHQQSDRSPHLPPAQGSAPTEEGYSILVLEFISLLSSCSSR